MFCTLASLFYLIITIGATFVWLSAKESSSTRLIAPGISVVVIARDEADNIEKCLRHIAQNDYPIGRYEIILVDDHSSDQTVKIARSLEIKNLHIIELADLDNPPINDFFKKAGQRHGVNSAKYEWILQTDADCFCSPLWLQAMAQNCERKDLITGPIFIDGTAGTLSRWQTYENIGIMASTFAGIKLRTWYSANAGNMMFKKDLYLQYANEIVHQSASGDDIFLINWARGWNKEIGFAKSPSAIVTTGAENTVRGFYQQRLRWATKTKGYSYSGLKWLMSGLFIFHIIVIITGLSALFISDAYLISFVILWLAKWIGDTCLLRLVAPFYGIKYPILLSPVFSILHLSYVVFFGFCGILMRNYTWKGRRVH